MAEPPGNWGRLQNERGERPNQPPGGKFIYWRGKFIYFGRRGARLYLQDIYFLGKVIYGGARRSLVHELGS
jgi:hypothetical protein